MENQPPRFVTFSENERIVVKGSKKKRGRRAIKREIDVAIDGRRWILRT